MEEAQAQAHMQAHQRVDLANHRVMAKRIQEDVLLHVQMP